MPRLSLWLEFADGSTIGPLDVRLLEEIGEHRSIVAASRAVKMSYSSAWRRVRTLNGCSGGPLVKAGVGGRIGGFAELTQRGQTFVQLYRLMERRAVTATRAELRRGRSKRQMNGRKTWPRDLIKKGELEESI